jgi:hypothetical protein
VSASRLLVDLFHRARQVHINHFEGPVRSASLATSVFKYRYREIDLACIGIFIAEALPTNTAGKLLKRELRLLYAGSESAALGGGAR